MIRPTATGGTRLILQPPGTVDPRTLLDEQALVVASANRFPVVARRAERRDGMGLAAGGAIALLLGGVTFWSMSGHRAPPAARTVPATTIVQPAAPPTGTAALPAAVPPGLMMPSVPSTAPLPFAPAPAAAPGAAPAMVFDASAGAPVPTAATAPGAAPAAAGGGPAAAGTADDQFAARVGDGDAQTATARTLDDPSTTIVQGTLIAAVLETAIDTDLPGYARALVSRDVKSFDGTRVLVPRSSRLIGQYKSGLAAGQTRAYVIWTRLIRPDGASVALGSPGVDVAGTTGLAGKVDGHFMKRFGSAALLSVIGGLGAVGSGGTSVILQGGGQSAAAVAAQRDTAIPPTIRVAQGQPIRVFTAKDLDFASVPQVVAAR